MQSKTHNKIQKMKKTVFNAVFFYFFAIIYYCPHQSIRPTSRIFNAF